MPSPFFTVQEDVEQEAPRSILLIGALNSRKTTTAATASKFCPWPIQTYEKPYPKPIRLEDTFYIKWDQDALLGFPHLGLSAPSVDVSGVKPSDLIPSPRNPKFAALEDLHAETQLRLEQGARIIVHDTLGSFDQKVLAYCTELFDRGLETVKDRGQEGAQRNASQVLYRAMLKVHVQEFQFYTTLKCPDGTYPLNIFLCHGAVKGESMASKRDTEAQAAAHLRNLTLGLDEEGGQIAAKLTGDAWRFYNTQCGLIMLINSIGEGANRRTTLYPLGGLNSLTRDRGGVLSAEEEPNLRALLRKYEP